MAKLPAHRPVRRSRLAVAAASRACEAAAASPLLSAVLSPTPARKDSRMPVYASTSHAFLVLRRTESPKIEADSMALGTSGPI